MLWAIIKVLGDSLRVDVRRWSLDLYPRSYDIQDSNLDFIALGDFILKVHCKDNTLASFFDETYGELANSNKVCKDNFLKGL